jgi:hypothetical protein
MFEVIRVAVAATRKNLLKAGDTDSVGAALGIQAKAAKGYKKLNRRGTAKGGATKKQRAQFAKKKFLLVDVPCKFNATDTTQVKILNSAKLLQIALSPESVKWMFQYFESEDKAGSVSMKEVLFDESKFFVQFKRDKNAYVVHGPCYGEEFPVSKKASCGRMLGTEEYMALLASTHKQASAALQQQLLIVKAKASNKSFASSSPSSASNFLEDDSQASSAVVISDESQENSCSEHDSLISAATLEDESQHLYVPMASGGEDVLSDSQLF